MCVHVHSRTCLYMYIHVHVCVHMGTNDLLRAARGVLIMIEASTTHMQGVLVAYHWEWCGQLVEDWQSSCAAKHRMLSFYGRVVTARSQQLMPHSELRGGAYREWITHQLHDM